MLKIDGLSIHYGSLCAVRDISMSIASGEMVCLVGANGAGKSSCLKGIMGLASATGDITLDGVPLQSLPVDQRVASGLALVPEGRHVFPDMPVLENLKLGRRGYSDRDADILESVLNRFPILRSRRAQAAGTLSGGEQQLLAIGRALMSSPRYLLLDEPTLGLAPLMVKEVGRILKDIQSEGVSVLIAEQNLLMALGISDRGYVMETGSISIEGSSKDLKTNERVRQAYLGL
jgi:branched-chain amino acid transport system ATP-binding protein